MEKIEINVSEGQKELIIREGLAAPIRMPNGWSKECQLKSVSDFYTKRKESISADNALLQVNYDTCTVKLTIKDCLSEEQIVLTGKLTENKDIVDLGINRTKTFNEQELETAFRKRPHLFRNVETYDAFMKSLRNFQVQVNSEIKKENDRNGNVAANAKVVATHNLEKEVQLMLSPFRGLAAGTYTVKIYVDVTKGDVQFYLECVDLMLNQEVMKREAIDEVVSDLKELPLLVE